MAIQSYILGLQNYDRVELQYIPNEIKGNRTPNYSKFNPSGRGNPIYHYTGGEESFSMQFSMTTQNSDRTDVLAKLQKLLTFTYNDGDKIPPQFVKLFFGDVSRDERLIITNIQFNQSLFNPNHDFHPDMAIIDITFSIAPPKNITHNDILKWQI